MICSEPYCPIESTRASLAAIRKEREGRGEARTHSVNEYWESCSVCLKCVGWLRDEDGNERRIGVGCAHE